MGDLRMVARAELAFHKGGFRLRLHAGELDAVRDLDHLHAIEPGKKSKCQ